MATIRLVADEGREIADTGHIVDPGATVDIEDGLADSLCEQVDVWQRVDASPTNRKRSAPADDVPPLGEEE